MDVLLLSRYHTIRCIAPNGFIMILPPSERRSVALYCNLRNPLREVSSAWMVYFPSTLLCSWRYLLLCRHPNQVHHQTVILEPARRSTNNRKKETSTDSSNTYFTLHKASVFVQISAGSVQSWKTTSARGFISSRYRWLMGS